MQNENKTIPATENPEILENKSVQEETISDTETSIELKPLEKRCPNCQALLTDEQPFCPDCGASLKKVCRRCNAELQENQAFCPSCGLNVAENVSATPTNISEYNSVVMNNQKKPKTSKFVLSAIVAVCICVVLMFSVNEYGKITLHNKLMKDEWSGISSDGNTLLFLDFSDGNIDYSGYFGILGKRTVSTIDYKVISRNKISVRGIEINVKFSNVGDTVTFVPSFIDSRSVSIWTK